MPRFLHSSVHRRRVVTMMGVIQAMSTPTRPTHHVLTSSSHMVHSVQRVLFPATCTEKPATPILHLSFQNVRRRARNHRASNFYVLCVGFGVGKWKKGGRTDRSTLLPRPTRIDCTDVNEHKLQERRNPLFFRLIAGRTEPVVAALLANL